MPSAVYLIRHGAYDHRVVAPGTEAACDFGLSALGRAQVDALAGRLARTREIAADHLYSSTLPRAVQTAAAIAPSLGCTPQPLADLCEWESGNDVLGTEHFMARFNGLPWPERRHHRFVPGCETIAEFTQRVQAALGGLVERHDGQCLVLVVHGGVIEAAFHHFLGFGPGPFQGGYPAAGHASITHWQRSTARSDWVQMVANDTHHLRGLA